MNPQNVCVFQGIISQVKIIKYKNSNEINYIEFRLNIPRNYLNKGEQKHDSPIIHLSSFHRDFNKFKDMIKENNEVSVIGQYTTEKHVWEGKDCFKSYILLEDIVFKSTVSSGNTSQEEYCELPY